MYTPKAQSRDVSTIYFPMYNGHWKQHKSGTNRVILFGTSPLYQVELEVVGGN
jgi:hypothetical protein